MSVCHTTFQPLPPKLMSEIFPDVLYLSAMAYIVCEVNSVSNNRNIVLVILFYCVFVQSCAYARHILADNEKHGMNSKVTCSGSKIKINQSHNRIMMSFSQEQTI